ncbi:hypothetical protein ACPPVO_06420 [Dactylosporangium sp. McL0621]|uniref:hypothetical protein n=1 Tax=Dactylosporangium sp. McL0621 TaxID=3415678 RepID=UPI003CFA2D0A
MKQVDDDVEAGGILPWPEQAWQRAFEQVWMAGVRLIWLSFQVEKWYERQRRLRGLPERQNVVFTLPLPTAYNHSSGY